MISLGGGGVIQRGNLYCFSLCFRTFLTVWRGFIFVGQFLYFDGCDGSIDFHNFLLNSQSELSWPELRRFFFFVCLFPLYFCFAYLLVTLAYRSFLHNLLDNFRLFNSLFSQKLNMWFAIILCQCQSITVFTLSSNSSTFAILIEWFQFICKDIFVWKCKFKKGGDHILY